MMPNHKSHTSQGLATFYVGYSQSTMHPDISDLGWKEPQNHSLGNASGETELDFLHQSDLEREGESEHGKGFQICKRA